MGQVLHGCAATTETVRRAIQQSQGSIRALAHRYSINPKTFAKWKRRDHVHDAPMGPKQPRSTILSADEEATIVAFRKQTLLPLDDCVYTLQETIPHLTCSALHRCLQRHGISRLPDTRDRPQKKRFKQYPIGYFHIDMAKDHLQTYLMAYNLARRLKTPKGLTPYEYICHRWEVEPERFAFSPYHHTLGLYT